MKLFLLAALLSLSLNAHAAAKPETIYHCLVTEVQQEIGAITISYAKETDQYLMGIELLKPHTSVIEEQGAVDFSDFTVEGYYSEQLDASVLFFNENDDGGKRKVLHLKGQELPISCRYIPARLRAAAH